jgi:hypothetical protein
LLGHLAGPTRVQEKKRRTSVKQIHGRFVSVKVVNVNINININVNVNVSVNTNVDVFVNVNVVFAANTVVF